MEESTQNQELDKQIQLLRQLGSMPQFQEWRTLVVNPVIQQLRDDLYDPLKFSEAELKAKVLHLNTVEYLFKGIFDQLDATK
jgi:hypothetical protein